MSFVDDWRAAHGTCTHDDSREASLACFVARRPALDDLQSDDCRDMAAEVYSMWVQFGEDEFGWQDWAPGRSGVDGHREWRLMLERLRHWRVPHELEPTVDEQTGLRCNRLRLDQRSWAWQAKEGGLVCSVCESLFRPDDAATVNAWRRRRVRCEVCA